MMGAQNHAIVAAGATFFASTPASASARTVLWRAHVCGRARRGCAVKAGAAVWLACLLVLSHPGAAAAMSFQMAQSPSLAGCSRNCGPAIAAEGEITDATPDSFARFVQANALGRGRAVVFIDSQGGKILAGMQLGKIFRKLGVTAVVARVAQGDEGGPAELAAGTCFSACVYALMGAKTRIAPRRSQIGIYRMFALNGDLAALRQWRNGGSAQRL